MAETVSEIVRVDSAAPLIKRRRNRNRGNRQRRSQGSQFMEHLSSKIM